MSVQEAYVTIFHDNFETIKTTTWFKVSKINQQIQPYSVGSTYICGAGCDFIYTVLNCGGQNAGEFPCPWCKKTLGGRNHKLHSSAGHANLSDDEARSYLKELMTKYQTQQKPGYSEASEINNEIEKTNSNMQSTSWRLIRMFLHVPLYFMQITNKVNDQMVEAILSQESLALIHSTNQSIKQFIESHIKNDLNILFKQLSVSGPNLPAPWIYSVLQTLLNSFEEPNQSPTTAAIRNAYQNVFSKDYIQPYLQNVSVIANQMKLKQVTNDNLFEQALDEITCDQTLYPYLPLYRLVRDSSYDDMRNAFYMDAENANKFKLLKICFENQDDLSKLRKFGDIIEFTSALLLMFNHYLRRDEARVKPIKDFFNNREYGQQLKQLFRRFKNAWNTMAFDQKIQFRCYQLDYLKYSEDSEIINFLIDNKELGNGMCMAAGLQELTEIQNKLLSNLASAYSQENNIDQSVCFDTFKYPVQKVKAAQIININLDETEIIKTCYMNNYVYGSGQDLVYDFQRIQNKIVSGFMNKKMLNTEQLDFIYYQLELIATQSDNSALIASIRKVLKQEPFDKQTQIQVDLYFNFIKNRSEQEYISVLRQVLTMLEKLLCYLLNAKEQIETTIQQFSAKVKNTIDLKLQNSVVSSIQLSNIVCLYENIESRLFPYIEDSLRLEFTCKDNAEEIKETLQQFLQYCDNKLHPFPTRGQVQTALMRFMIRCLAGQLVPTHPLSEYINRPDFWDESLEEEKLDNFKTKFPSNINIDHAICTYKIMNELNQAVERRLVAPQLANSQSRAQAAAKRKQKQQIEEFM